MSCDFNKNLPEHYISKFYMMHSYLCRRLNITRVAGSTQKVIIIRLDNDSN